MPLDLTKLRHELCYDAATGQFIWSVSKPGILAGTIAGVIDPSTGYFRIGWDKRLHYGHRLAWVWVNGEIEKGMVVKQRNDDRADCRIDNLYLIGTGENRRLQRD